MEYSDKKALYEDNFSLGIFTSETVNDKLILLSLVSLVYLKTKEKKPNIKSIDILKQIVPNYSSKNKHKLKMLESLSITVEELCCGCTTADACGMTSSKEIINKINELLNTWIPF